MIQLKLYGYTRKEILKLQEGFKNSLKNIQQSCGDKQCELCEFSNVCRDYYNVIAFLYKVMQDGKFAKRSERFTKP